MKISCNSMKLNLMHCSTILFILFLPIRGVGIDQNELCKWICSKLLLNKSYGRPLLHHIAYNNTGNEFIGFERTKQHQQDVLWHSFLQRKNDTKTLNCFKHVTATNYRANSNSQIILACTSYITELRIHDLDHHPYWYIPVISCNNPITATQCNPNDSNHIAALSSKKIHIYDPREKREIATLAQNDTINTFTYNPRDFHELACGTEDGIVTIWDLRMNKHKLIWPIVNSILTLTYNPYNAHTLIAGVENKSMIFFDTDTGNYEICKTNINNIDHLTLSRKNPFLVATSPEMIIFTNSVNTPQNLCFVTDIMDNNTLKNISYNETNDTFTLTHVAEKPFEERYYMCFETFNAQYIPKVVTTFENSDDEKIPALYEIYQKYKDTNEHDEAQLSDLERDLSEILDLKL